MHLSPHLNSALCWGDFQNRDDVLICTARPWQLVCTWIKHPRRKSLPNIVSLLWSAQRFHQKDSGERETGHCCADDLVCCGGHSGTQQQRSPMQHAPCLFLYPNMGNTILLVPSCWKCSNLVSALSFHGRWRFAKKIIQKNLKLWISEDQETTRALVIYSFPIHYASLTI